MFRILIKCTLQALETLQKYIQKVYDNLYSNSDIERELKKEVEAIKKRNKEAFLSAARNFCMTKGILTLELPSMKEINKRANQMWKEALEKGDLDELYAIKERNENGNKLF